mgnify:CR=1 FL=1
MQDDGIPVRTAPRKVSALPISAFTGKEETPFASHDGHSGRTRRQVLPRL